jgi:hypothetical protein
MSKMEVVPRLRVKISVQNGHTKKDTKIFLERLHEVLNGESPSGCRVSLS